ncbi:MAG TPA: MFS transporter [Candidatus Binataceae bacterium]|nr:MFS transporter [Candidatus Binataceae bacterium]
MRPKAFELLERRDFRRLYLAVAISELGDSFHYIALMWIALVMGGPLGVIAVRLADSIPALVFGFHGGIAADKWNRKHLMVAADLTRAIVLIPVAIAGLTGKLPLWGLVVAAFLLETATSYFAPAYGATVPTLVDRANVQEANGLVTSTANALSIGGWAAAAGLLAILPISAFFALNSLSFFASAFFISGIVSGDRVGAADGQAQPRVREAFSAMRPHKALTSGVVVLAIAITISAGTWITGVPELVRNVIHRDAGGYSIVMVGYAIGSILAGALLARFPINNKPRASLLAWILYLPGYGMFALSTSLPMAVAGSMLAAIGQSAALILLTSAAQESIRDEALGRVMGLISLVHRGAHATGLILISPLFAVFATRSLFALAAVAISATGIAGAMLSISTATGRLTEPAN